MLGGHTAQLLRGNASSVTELRLRIGRPAIVRLLGRVNLPGDPVHREPFSALMNRLMENSLYARERELRQGYFTAFGGCRVGVCGHVCAGSEGVQSISAIASACIRIPRELPGCADEIFRMLPMDRPRSLLLLSPPGLGKTTMLRDLVRRVSDAGFQVALADERRELAACCEGVPQLDVGASTDVMDGLDKQRAIPMLLRSCAPDLIAVDELGGEGDAQAILEAARCGAAVAASAHAANLRDAMLRPCIGGLIRRGIFQHIVVLGPVPGKIKALHTCADAKFQMERFQDAEGFIAGDHSSELHGCGTGGERAAQAAQ